MWLRVRKAIRRRLFDETRFSPMTRLYSLCGFLGINTYFQFLSLRVAFEQASLPDDLFGATGKAEQ
jgi:hypothetical protein